MTTNLLDRADAARLKIELLNGADSIGLLEFLILRLGKDGNFVHACEVWLKAKGE